MTFADTRNDSNEGPRPAKSLTCASVLPPDADKASRGEWRTQRSALDWMAVAAEEHGREIVEVYLRAMRGGDWRAAEALMSRIYGKPEAAVVAHVPPTPHCLC